MTGVNHKGDEEQPNMKGQSQGDVRQNKVQERQEIGNIIIACVIPRYVSI